MYFTVKSIIKYYTGHNTPVYTCFLDASKDFDRVNHWTLFTKLIYSGISRLIVRIHNKNNNIYLKPRVLQIKMCLDTFFERIKGL